MGGPVGCIEVGPVPNEYYQPICVTNPADPGCTAPWEPPCRPGVPNPSIPGESFLDTPIVNGTAYPYLEVEPKAYRFRVLNASNDRFLNLQLYVAADKTAPTTADTDYTATPATSAARAAYRLATARRSRWSRSVWRRRTNMRTRRAAFPIRQRKDRTGSMIGTEGGFMPKPVVVPQQPIGYNLDPAYFNFGVVNQHSLFLGSAERADVVVDFSAYAGKTLILYNDSPAPVPAGAAPYDFYTGNGNQMDGGGAPNTQPGYGPNTRTIMQIRVTKPLTTPTHGRHACESRGGLCEDRHEAGRLRGVAGPDHHSAGGLQLRLQHLVPDDRCAAVYPDRRHAEDLPAYQRERGSSACCHAAARDEGHA